MTAVSTVVDVKALIDERPVTAYQWLLVALCFLVVVADGMDVAIMGFVAPSILQEWHISRPAFGLVMSAAPIGLVIGALVAGPSSDRIGRKTVLITSVLLFGLFTIATSYTGSPTEMAALRLLTGIGLLYGRTGALNLAQAGAALAHCPADGLVIVAFTLIAVGFLMCRQLTRVDFNAVETALPAFVIAVAIPFTWSISHGIGYGFITYAAVQLVCGRARSRPCG